ncbi:MAG TPA: hypothetical protein VG817_11620 [Gemmatimonadales bacterium]|nr:hypothetical protein [Gemmatimonadales bacterium]
MRSRAVPPEITEAQVKASGPLADATMQALANDHGIHAETAVSAIARSAGMYLFHSFGLPAAGISPGDPVLSELANERGPLLLHTLQAGLQGLGLTAGQPQRDPLETNPPQLSLLDTQQRLEPRLTPMAAASGFTTEQMAHACALATALMIYRTRSVLDSSVAFGVAAYGVVEGTKTMPIPLSLPLKR